MTEGHNFFYDFFMLICYLFLYSLLAQLVVILIFVMSAKAIKDEKNDFEEVAREKERDDFKSVTELTSTSSELNGSISEFVVSEKNGNNVGIDSDEDIEAALDASEVFENSDQAAEIWESSSPVKEDDNRARKESPNEKSSVVKRSPSLFQKIFKRSSLDSSLTRVEESPVNKSNEIEQVSSKDSTNIETSSPQKEIQSTPDVQRIKIFPSCDEASDNGESPEDDSVSDDATVINDLNDDLPRIPSHKTKITPDNVDESPAISDISVKTMSHNGSACFLIPGEPTKIAPRVSLSEPLTAPPGFKILMTAMEVGLLRDVVVYAAVIHENLIENDGILSKSYAKCFKTIDIGLSTAQIIADFIARIYHKISPNFVAVKVRGMKTEIWQHWEGFDEKLGSRISLEVANRPLIRKSFFELIQDFQTTRVGKICSSVSQSALWVVKKVRK